MELKIRVGIKVKNMAKGKEFKVAIVGFSETQSKVLSSICWLSRSRNRKITYTLVKKTTDAQVIIFNADSKKVQSFWEQKSNTLTRSKKKIVWVGQKNDALLQKEYRLTLPFTAPKVFEVIDHLIFTEFNSAPDLRIGDSEETKIMPRLLKHNNTENQTYSHTKVLVVDDSEIIRNQIKIELRSLGIQADFAESGEDALRKVQNKHYELILLDIVLPGIDGYQVCKIIKKQYDTKVIMLTSESSALNKVKGLIAGCDSYLTKPVSHEKFLRTAKKYLSKMAMT